MEIFKNKKDCCGCTACKSICPKNAITMTADEEGFLYPKIDKSKCIECGACKRVCAFQNGYIKNHSQKAYAIKHKNEQTRFTSRSGGVFIALSDYILNNNGVIYGVAFDSDYSIHHIRATNKTDRDLMKGSKYVQSNLEDCFINIKKDLKQGLTVMFSGTGCQVGGLTKYLENVDTTNLYTCDIICHGVPSATIWNDYVNLMKKRFGDNIEQISFRDKSVGWRQHKESFVINGEKHYNNEFAYLFLGSQILRPSCFNCKYTNIDRPSDFTLADCWGVHRRLPEFNDNKGISSLMLNTTKAINLFENIKSDIDYRDDDIAGCVKANPNLYRPSMCPSNRDAFWKDYKNKGFEKTLKKYYRKETNKRIVKKLKVKAKKVIKK